jgi:hypothetical protein
MLLSLCLEPIKSQPLSNIQIITQVEHPLNIETKVDNPNYRLKTNGLLNLICVTVLSNVRISFGCMG